MSVIVHVAEFKEQGADGGGGESFSPHSWYAFFPPDQAGAAPQ